MNSFSKNNSMSQFVFHEIATWKMQPNISVIPTKKGAGKFKTRFHHFRYSSSERDEPPKRFHNIESQSFGPYGVVARARSGSRASTEPGGSGNGNKTPSYRSRSMSRSPQYAEAKRDLKASRELNKSTGDIMRSDLDNERAGRLRRAMSFK